MQRLAALSSGIIRIEELPSEIVSTPQVASVMNEVIPEGELPTLQQLESSYLVRVLERRRRKQVPSRSCHGGRPQDLVSNDRPAGRRAPRITRKAS